MSHLFYKPIFPQLLIDMGLNHSHLNPNNLSHKCELHTLYFPHVEGLPSIYLYRCWHTRLPRHRHLNGIRRLTITTSRRLLIQGVDLLLKLDSDTTIRSSWGGNINIYSNTHLKDKNSPKQVRETPHIHPKP